MSMSCQTILQHLSLRGNTKHSEVCWEHSREGCLYNSPALILAYRRLLLSFLCPLQECSVQSCSVTIGKKAPLDTDLTRSLGMQHAILWEITWRNIWCQHSFIFFILHSDRQNNGSWIWQSPSILLYMAKETLKAWTSLESWNKMVMLGYSHEINVIMRITTRNKRPEVDRLVGT